MELCKKKEKNLTPLEKILAHYGDAWVWVGFDPVSKLLPAFVVGKRTKANAYKLIERIYRVTDGAIPLCTSDELRHYRDALLRVYGIREEVPKGPRKRGRPRKPKLRPPPELRYAQVVKHRRKGRVISITTKVIFGKEQEVKELLQASPVSKSVNISFVERNNLTLRQQSTGDWGERQMGSPKTSVNWRRSCTSPWDIITLLKSISDFVESPKTIIKSGSRELPLWRRVSPITSGAPENY